MLRSLRWFAPLAALTVLANCSSDSSAGPVCNAGKQVACDCPAGAQGVQVCKADGSGYDACDCGAAAGGAGGASEGGQGGSSTGGSSAGGTAGGSAGMSGAGGSTVTPVMCPPDTATDLSGECDVTLQNCPDGLTCGPREKTGGGYETACIEVGKGAVPLAGACMSHSECAPGLRCTLRKCTRPCCTDKAGEICGSAGQCDLNITYDNGANFLQVCTFSPKCTPWANDCPTDGPETDCHIDPAGGFSCGFPNYDPMAGSTVGKPCTFLNDCGDSQHCVYNSNQMGTCRWLCKASDTDGAPAAGTVGGSPGDGGCPSGETCVAYNDPMWLGRCQ